MVTSRRGDSPRIKVSILGPVGSLGPGTQATQADNKFSGHGLSSLWNLNFPPPRLGGPRLPTRTHRTNYRHFYSGTALPSYCISIFLGSPVSVLSSIIQLYLNRRLGLSSPDKSLIACSPIARAGSATQGEHNCCHQGRLSAAIGSTEKNKKASHFTKST